MLTPASSEIQTVVEQILEKVGEIALQLHQLTDLEALLSYGVQATQSFLQSDRALIYQFLPEGDGVVIAEVVREGWQPILGQLIHDPCFQTHWAEPYRQGRISQIADVEQSDLQPCHREMLMQIQVKANLVVPILLCSTGHSQNPSEPSLWGLFILHQCRGARPWQSLEVQFVKQIALQLGVALAHLQAQQQRQAELQKQQATITELRQAKSHLEQTIDQSPVVIMRFAPDGSFRSANPAWETLWQAPRERLVGFNPLHDPQLIAANHLQFWQRVQQGEAVTYTPIYYTPTLSGHVGRAQWSEGQLYPIKDAAGKVQEIVLIQYDVSERIIAQQERDRFFTNAHDLMAIADQNGLISLANPAWKTILGYDPEALVGACFLDLFHPEDLPAALTVYQQHMHTQQTVHNCELRCRHQDGSYRWISWNGVYSNGLSYGFGRDITQQKQLEVSLEKQEERWQLAIRGSNDGIWDWNILTGELFLSPRWKEMLGYCDDEIEHVLQAWESRVHPDDLDRAKQAVQAHLQRQTPFYEVEHRLRCKDGSYKWILARAQAVWDGTGQAIRMVGSHTDISGRKQAEQELQHSIAELTRLNQLKDDFLSTVSHELRTPMANIKMATQMLEISLQSLGLLANDRCATVDRYFQILKAECRREIQLINDLLDLTHLESSPELLNLTAVQLPTLISQIATPLLEQFQQQQQRFQLDVPELLPRLVTNQFYLERIISELLNNACKYTPTGERICLVVQANPDRVEISISNSGIEIAAAERDRVFDKFYRIPHHDPWRHGGTGLGLALVKKMVDHLAGSITIEDGPPGWTTFALRLAWDPRRGEDGRRW